MKPLFKLRPEILTGPNVPRPLHGTAPRLVLGSKWWNVTKKQAYLSTGHRCVACGVHKTCAKYRQWVEAHEVYSVDYEAGRMYYEETVPLCHLCHCYVHDGRMRALLAANKLHFGKFTAVIQHGESVIEAAGIPARLPYTVRDSVFVHGMLKGAYPTPELWRLVVNDIEYPPITKTKNHE